VGFPLRLLVGMMLVCVTITAAVAVSVRVGGDLLEAIRDAVGGVVHAG
jgi:flagellar biosynthesis protein FliR